MAGISSHPRIPKMKAISLWQPWASAIPAGVKTIETRGWATGYLGPLAIHAAKRWTAEELYFWQLHIENPVHVEDRNAFRKIGVLNHKDLPLGCIVATCELYACLSTSGDTVDAPGHVCAPNEIDWGNFEPGRFAWFLRNIKPLHLPIPCVGRQGFFDWAP